MKRRRSSIVESRPPDASGFDSGFLSLLNRRVTRRQALSTTGKVAVGIGAVVVIGAAAYAAYSSLTPSPSKPISATTTSSASVATTSLTPINVGLLPLTSYLPFYIASQKGFFKEENLDFKFFTAPGDVQVPQVGSGKLDVGTGGVSAGLYNAFIQGLSLKLVASYNTWRNGVGDIDIVVRKDLYDKGEITSLKDLKGRKIAEFAGVGGTDWIFLTYALDSAGLDIRKDVTLVEIPFPNMVGALTKGSVDAAGIAPPFTNYSLNQGAATLLLHGPDLPSLATFQLGTIMMNADFLNKNRNAAVRFMVAWIRATRYETDPKNKDDVINMASQFTHLDAAFLNTLYGSKYWMTPPPDLKPNIDSMTNQQDLLNKYGLLKGKPVPPSAWYDPSVVDDALKIING